MGGLFSVQKFSSKVSVIIPTMKGREELLKKLILTIPKHYELIIVDDEDLLLAAKRNKGAKRATGEYLFFVDDDNYLAASSIHYALDFLTQNEGVGIVGFMANYHDKPNFVADGGSMRNYLTGFTSGVNTNKDWRVIDKRAYEVDEIANAFMMHCETFYELHGFDEKNFPIDLDEADLCKRVKDKGLKIVLHPLALCYHKSQTYSHIPDFRRPINAYFMGRNRVLYQRKHNSRVRFWCHVVLFVPVFICFYSASLLSRKKPSMIVHFLKGVIDGLQGRLENKYQKR